MKNEYLKCVTTNHNDTMTLTVIEIVIAIVVIGTLSRHYLLIDNAIKYNIQSEPK